MIYPIIYPIPSMSQCECVCLWDGTPVSVSRTRALLFLDPF